MRKFRFITKKEYLANKNSYQTFYSGMEHLFGQEIDISKTNLSEAKFLLNFDNDIRENFTYKHNLINWAININSVIEIIESKEEINMERIRKEDWRGIFIDEEILGVEMRDGNKYYLAPNSDGFVPINLKKHYDGGYADTTNLESGITQCNVLDGDKKVFKFESMQEVITWATS